MIPASFDYHRPKSVQEAVSLLASLGEEARIVAGGHSLIPMMKLRMAVPGHIVDLRSVGELDFIREEAGGIAIGAMVTQAKLIASAAAARACPILREAALQVADPQVRNCGTIGGNVANGDPGNDMPAVMQALDAEFEVQGSGRRRVKAREFYEGTFATALGAGEVLTSIHVPKMPAGHGSAYVKQKRKIGDYATAAAAVILARQGGKCTHAAIALTNLGDTPLYAEAAGAALVGTGIDKAAVDEAVRLAVEITAPAADGRGPVEFRQAVAGVMVRRAIETALSRAA